MSGLKRVGFLMHLVLAAQCTSCIVLQRAPVPGPGLENIVVST